MMKIVVGTRHWLGEDWFHVDGSDFPLWNDETEQWYPVDLVCDARAVELEDGVGDIVYSQECLEHFPRSEYFDVLTEWSRLVKVGGQLKIEVPDLLLACEEVLDADTLDMDRRIQQIIYGGQENEFDFHYIGFTPRMLEEDFLKLGYKINSIERGGDVGWLRIVGTKE